MFANLARNLEDGDDPRRVAHARKVEAIKEGLYQICDVVIERDVEFKEARRQDCLVQYRLSKSLGHSRCLYTLLLFHLYCNVRDIDGNVRDIEVHVGKCIYGKGGRKNSRVKVMNRL
jgi:hypothetical protein